MTRLLLVAASVFALALPAIATAADPIEGRWVSAGVTVLVGPLPGGGFHGVAVSQSASYACVTPGTEVWPSITGGPSSYSGTINLFTSQPCAPAGTSPASFVLSAPTFGVVCATAVPGQPCEAMVRAVACNDGLDDDGDADVDMADPGCDRPTDESEAPDPALSVADSSLFEGSRSFGSVIPVTLSMPSAQPVSFSVAAAAGTATPGVDFSFPSPGVQIPAGQQYGSVPVSIVPDLVPEPNETFILQLTSLSGARPGRLSATITILDGGASGPLYDGERERSPARRTTGTRGGSDDRGSSAEDLPVCGLKPPTFAGRPKAGKDGRQRCPKPRPRTRSSRGGSAGVDRMTGSGRANALAGLGGNDTLRGLAGGDRLAGGRGDDGLWGGTGGDVLDGGDGDDDLRGGPGSDWLVELRYGDDRLDGGPGDDVIAGNHGHDTIRGGPGDDIISGGSGPDRVDCGPGYDTLYVNLGSDRGRSRGCERIRSESDIRQRLCGEGGTNAGEQVRGGSGSDTCRGRGGNDVLEGAGGSDRLYGDAGNDTLFGRKGSELMYGGDGNDVLEGGQGADRMYGGRGRDVLNGGYGRDRLSGGAGNDTLNAGFGDRGEIVDCGPGYDTWVFGPGDKPRGCEVTRR